MNEFADIWTNTKARGNNIIKTGHGDTMTVNTENIKQSVQHAGNFVLTGIWFRVKIDSDDEEGCKKVGGSIS